MTVLASALRILDFGIIAIIQENKAFFFLSFSVPLIVEAA